MGSKGPLLRILLRSKSYEELLRRAGRAIHSYRTILPAMSPAYAYPGHQARQASADNLRLSLPVIISGHR